MRVEVRLLGGFEVSVDGRALPASAWGRRSAASLVKLLALQPGHRLLRDQVIDALWPDLLLEDAAPRLHQATHHARSALGSREAVVLRSGMLVLLPGAELTVDVAEFERAAEKAIAHGDPQPAAAAAAAYPGDLLPEDLYEPWTEEPRSRLRLRWLELLPAAGRFEELVAAEPLDEEAHLALVRHHLAAGRRQAALAALDRMAQVLGKELGTVPGPAADELRRQAEQLSLGAPGPARTSLPPPRVRVIGRESDLAAVTDLVRQHRVVTVTGPGGVGKSTLALAVARALQSGDDGSADTDVVLAELAPVQSAAHVVRAVAEAAGVQGEGAVRVASLAATIGPRPVLLLLDNCEHLLDPSAELVDAILDAGAGARVLVTSREPLRIDGEVEYRLQSLGRESAELFVERAAAAVGPGVVSPDDPHVVELCERLDGLPLAIELAAAQLRHIAVPELVARLDDRLSLLVGGRPKGGERHSALAATIEWSYRLLPDDSRGVLDRLGVFPAGFDLAAVQAVAQEHPTTTVTNLLGDLVAKSLVVHDPARGRYSMLESIRLFAEERMEKSGRRAETRERLRQHCVGRVTGESRSRAWLSPTLAARCRDDLDNVRLAFETSLECGDVTGAVDLSIGLSTLWRNAVSYAEGRRWVAALLERDLAPRDRLWALILDADVNLGAGSARRMREASERAAALSAEVDDEPAALIAGIYEALGHLPTPALVVERLERVAVQARACGEDGLERLARAYRVVALTLLGRSPDLRTEARTLTEDAPQRDYARYLCLWAASLVALSEQDGAWQRHLMDIQHADLSATAIDENWLTLYWEALARIAEGEDFVPHLRRARSWAEAEGRSADADCVLALAYAEACRDQWERAAELLGATEGALLHDTAGFIHQRVLREQVVQPRLEPAAFRRLVRRGQAHRLVDLLRDAGLVDA